MRVGIVWKLFGLTTALCSLILAVIYVGQTLFFKEYYINRKVADIEAELRSFAEKYAVGDEADIAKLERNLDLNHGVWATVLDEYGNPRQTMYLETKLAEDPDGPPYRVPLDALVPEDGANADISALARGTYIIIQGIKRTGLFLPIALEAPELGASWKDERLASLTDELVGEYKRRYAEEKAPPPFEFTASKAIVDNVRMQLPEDGSESPGDNELFLDRIEEFRVDLLLGEEMKADALTTDFEQNDVRYQWFVRPLMNDRGEAAYLVALVSLQPVDEAVRMVEDYYVYVVAFATVLIVLVALYHAIRIARPLLAINRTTKRLAELDFTAAVPISSRDEIGELSLSINTLSSSLQAHIGQLKEDIEKEKRLETTRKEFISGVSHELKTPLSVMKSCLSILKDGVAGEKRDYYFAALEREVDKMDLLVADMLDLAKYESGTYRLKTEPFPIEKSVEAVCEQLALKLAEKRLRLKASLEPAVVVANQRLIEQVAVNFLNNAIQYTPEEERIDILVAREGERVLVRVENKGARIPDEQLDKVWDRFYRGDSSRRRSEGGSGLGLAISKNILELHGVPYGAGNTEDGVAFYFYLDMHAE
ncbi:sensor histidine kinase [Cohnella massiliensis]|uniref:sensor histidine kinase n=1 Tax=Cohnella massiliensis TaxID=1816691 RepID=UPI0009BA5290|nr:HAMP domain-containing sensor histidine kinase [Cohnella massiliensis]